jgi:hypothetical protein
MASTTSSATRAVRTSSRQILIGTSTKVPRIPSPHRLSTTETARLASSCRSLGLYDWLRLALLAARVVDPGAGLPKRSPRPVACDVCMTTMSHAPSGAA